MSFKRGEDSNEISWQVANDEKNILLGFWSANYKIIWYTVKGTVKYGHIRQVVA